MILPCQKWVNYLSISLIHIPDVVTGKEHALLLSNEGKVESRSILGLLSLCSLNQMVHLLDARTYKPQSGLKMTGKSGEQLLSVRDVNCVPNLERLGRAYARGQALEIIDWMTTTFTLDGKQWETLADTWLRHHMMAVVKFHRYKQMQQPNDCNTIDPSQLTRQFVWHYLDIEPELVQDLIKTKMRSIAWPWDRKYTYCGLFRKALWCGCKG